MRRNLLARGYREALDSVGNRTGKWWSPNVALPNGEGVRTSLFETIEAAYEDIK